MRGLHSSLFPLLFRPGPGRDNKIHQMLMIMKKWILYSVAVLSLGCSCASSHQGEAPVALVWENGVYDAPTQMYRHRFVIKNTTDRELAGGWEIFYAQLPVTVKNDPESPVGITAVNANYYKMAPTDRYRNIAPHDSLVVVYYADSRAANLSRQPEGCYWVADASKNIPLPVELTVVEPTDRERMGHLSAEAIYRRNARYSCPFDSTAPAVLPSVKQAVPRGGVVSIPSEVSLLYNQELVNEARLLQEKLEQEYGFTVTEGAPMHIELDLSADAQNLAPEQYRLDIDDRQITVEGATPHGVFNGMQTLLALLRGGNRRLDRQTIVDYPDLSYRGFMLDVSRNFMPAVDVKRWIDILSSYKIDVLHLHLTDDEGWRIEIPGLEELTAVGGHRGHTVDESTCLYPAYDGSCSVTAGTGNGFYTRDEFIDLIRYAARRHVTVIPEIEAPGHARAAIVAMKARYRKYASTDEAKAREYLLSEPGDTSRYVSAQSYTDNVINVALPSTYTFMEKVVTEIAAMYTEAGVELQAMHLGGDEVPEGAWLGSAACTKLMQEKHLSGAHGLFEYFYRRMADWVESNGVKLAAWQEAALHNEAATDNRLKQVAGSIYCWNTIPEWGGDEIPYQTANKGYPVVLCNVNNFYMDLAYSSHYEERGHSWAGYVDEVKSFSMLPFSIYRSTRYDLQDNPVDLDRAADGKTPLDSLSNIVGVQAQLFSETLRGPQWADYYIFPKILGLVERGWNAHPSWETLHGQAEQQAFDREVSRFYHQLNRQEYPYLIQAGVNVRLPHVGLCVIDGLLYANSPLSSAVIRYTTDGSEPHGQSAVWRGPVACPAGSVVKARLYYLGKESVTTILFPTDAERDK